MVFEEEKQFYLSNYNYIYRTFNSFTPCSRRIFPGTSNRCYKCNTHKGVFIHLAEWPHSNLERCSLYNPGKALAISFYWLLFTHFTMLQTTQRLNLCFCFWPKKCILLKCSTPQIPTVDPKFLLLSLFEKLPHDLNQRSDRFRRTFYARLSFLQRLRTIWVFFWSTAIVCLCK